MVGGNPTFLLHYLRQNLFACSLNNVIFLVPFQHFLAVTNVYLSRDKSVQLGFFLLFLLTYLTLITASGSDQRNYPLPSDFHFLGAVSYRELLHATKINSCKIIG